MMCFTVEGDPDFGHQELRGLGQVGLLRLAGAYNLGNSVTPTNVWKGMMTLHTIPKKRLSLRIPHSIGPVPNLIGLIDWLVTIIAIIAIIPPHPAS